MSCTIDRKESQGAIRECQGATQQSQGEIRECQEARREMILAVDHHFARVMVTNRLKVGQMKKKKRRKRKKCEEKLGNAVDDLDDMDG